MTNGPPVSLLPVVAAVLTDVRGQVLIQRRAADKRHAGLWEFPGGKIEPGETPEAALARELAEELGIAADPETFDPINFASEPFCDRHLLLLLYRCRKWCGEPRALDADMLAWRLPNNLGDLPMLPGDRAFADRLVREE